MMATDTRPRTLQGLIDLLHAGASTAVDSISMP